MNEQYNFHGELDTALRAVAPVLGVSFGTHDDKKTWVPHFADTATAEQIQAAYEVIEQFDVQAAIDKSARRAALADTDAQMHRAAEDIIELLITKGIVRETDLPPALSARIETRKTLRTQA